MRTLHIHVKEVKVEGKEGKPEYREKNLLELRWETTRNSTHKILMVSTLGIRPRPHWWEISALTTVPSPPWLEWIISSFPMTNYKILNDFYHSWSWCIQSFSCIVHQVNDTCADQKKFPWIFSCYPQWEHSILYQLLQHHMVSEVTWLSHATHLVPLKFPEQPRP